MASGNSSNFTILCEGSNRDHIEIENNAVRYLWLKRKLGLDDKKIDDLMHTEEADEMSRNEPKRDEWQSLLATAESLLKKYESE